MGAALRFRILHSPLDPPPIQRMAQETPYNVGQALPPANSMIHRFHECEAGISPLYVVSYKNNYLCSYKDRYKHKNNTVQKA
jgi:hypothetical protein